MGRPNGGTRPDELTKLYRVVVDILRTDPDLGNFPLKTLRAWEGSRDDGEPPQLAEMPWVRVTPRGCPMVEGEVDHYQLKLPFLIEFATEGLLLDDLTNLWGCLRRALDHDKPYRGGNVMQALRSNSGTMGYMASPAFMPVLARPDSSGAAPTSATALFGSTVFFVLSDIPSQYIPPPG